MTLVTDYPPPPPSGTKRIYFVPLPHSPLTGANPLQGPFEGVGPENRDYLEINSDM